MLSLSAEAIGARAEALAGALRTAVPGLACAIEDGASEVGGGALPLQAIPTRVLTLRPERGRVTALEARLRTGEPPVLIRVHDEQVLLDLRTVAPGEEAALLAALTVALAGHQRMEGA